MKDLICPKCHKKDVIIQEKTKIITKKEHRSIIMWILFWWWFEIIMWVFFTIPRLLIALFVPSKQTITSKNYKEYVCQNCGYNGTERDFIHDDKPAIKDNAFSTTHIGFNSYLINVDYDKLYDCLINEILSKHGKIIKIFSNYLEVKIKAHIKPFTNPILMKIILSKKGNYVQLDIDSKCNDGAIGLNSINKMLSLLLNELTEKLNLNYKDITKL